jgi:ParB-like nuclease family protein
VRGEEVTTTTFAGEVHPFADKFPMLPAGQLQELAEDIEANGLLHPILLTPDGVLLDGRNRLAACQLVGVTPKFEVFEGNPVALVVSANAKRRQLSAGQRAMAIAVGMREQGFWDEEAGRWKRGAAKRNFVDTKVRGDDVALAGAILAYSQSLADEVLLGSPSLRAAYDFVQEQKEEARERERKRQELERHAPDLLGMIDDDFTLAMAYAAYEKRDEDRIAAERDLSEAKRKQVISTLYAIANLADHEASDERRELLPTLDLTSGPVTITNDQVEKAIKALQRIKKMMK